MFDDVIAAIADLPDPVVRWGIWVDVPDLDGGRGFIDRVDDFTPPDYRGGTALFLAAAAGFEVPDFGEEVERGIDRMSIPFAASPQFEAIARGYELARARVDVVAFVWDAGGAYVGAWVVFEGRIDGIPLRSDGDTQVRELALIYAYGVDAWRPQGQNKTDAAQRDRDPADGFRKYADIGQAVSMPWNGR